VLSLTTGAVEAKRKIAGFGFQVPIPSFGFSGMVSEFRDLLALLDDRRGGGEEEGVAVDALARPVLLARDDALAVLAVSGFGFS